MSLVESFGGVWIVVTLQNEVRILPSTLKRSTSSLLDMIAVCVANIVQAKILSQPIYQGSIEKLASNKSFPFLFFIGFAEIKIYRTQSLLDIANREIVIKSKMMMVHSEQYGERLWQCTDCNFAHKKTTNVSDHIEIKHIMVRVPCHICGMTFSTTSYFKKHMKHKHPNY